VVRRLSEAFRSRYRLFLLRVVLNGHLLNKKQRANQLDYDQGLEARLHQEQSHGHLPVGRFEHQERSR